MQNFVKDECILCCGHYYHKHSIAKAISYSPGEILSFTIYIYIYNIYILYYKYIYM